MISSWRRRRAARHAGKKQQPDENSGMELTIPNQFRCPISLDLMKDPVTLSTGITYDRESIERWIESGNHTCPITNQALRTLEPIPNHTIRTMIQDWCVENSSYGIERIPTPRIPVSSFQVSEMLSKATTAQKWRDERGCREVVSSIKALVKESERNKRCIVANGTSGVLSAIFEGFSKESFETNSVLLEEILSTLTLLEPLDGEAKSHLASTTSLHSIVWLLKCGGLSGRRNAVLMLKQVLSLDEQTVDDLVEIEGAIEAVFKLVKEPICPTTTKASLMVIYYMVSSSSYLANERVIASFVEMGLVSLLLEMLVESDRSVCEKALGVLDGLCSCAEGREQAYHHALTIPVLVKKLLRVSDLATDFAVCALWKLSKNEKRREGGGGDIDHDVLVEALQVGAFQKLLLLLQVGCGERIKEKATELLKMLNLHRDRLECIDSMDFKDLKRPF
ncbi:U-box domain-containing protein 21-like [Cornus florida]|uniref:U-box domain-containing protein 21-like n=1 Tax=Cornus florida TaxID=4283 RepID=UPI00289D0E4D|nr:U-box domain-containing protein 21-like [Cornus florida]